MTDAHDKENIRETIHKPVLLKEITEAFGKWSVDHQKNATKQLDPIYLDGTLGGAGHALAVAELYKGKLTIVGLDQDPRAIERARKALEGKATKVILANQNFRKLDQVLANNSVSGVDLLLLDLGFSSDELETGGIGLSFQKDEPLLMTYGDPASYIFTAKDVVNTWQEENIADVIFGYGEERYAQRIAAKIVEYRAKKQIETSGELAEIVVSAMPGFVRSAKTRGMLRIHPATKTFQALRIAVNDELNALREGLTKGYAALNRGGVMAVISFHSLEDRIVKNFMKEVEKDALKHGAGSIEISKKPLKASPEEIKTNPRARSAKLRILYKKIA